MKVTVRVTLEEGFLVEDSTITVIIDGAVAEEHTVLDVAPKHTWTTKVALAAEMLGRLPWGFLLDLLMKLRLWPAQHALPVEGVPVAGHVLELEAVQRGYAGDVVRSTGAGPSGEGCT
jgi:hypothetical protein